MAQHASRARQIPTERANTAYPQKLEHRRPSSAQRRYSVVGRKRQPLALPRDERTAEFEKLTGLVVEEQIGEFGAVQDAGDEVACGSERVVVAPLRKSA